MRSTSGVFNTVAGGLVAALGVSLIGALPAQADLGHQRRACSSGLVALTFDDGPSASVTPRLLSYLQRHHLTATFFVVGEQIPGNQRLLRRMAGHGFTIGNHTYHHENLTTLSNAQIHRTLAHTRRALRRAGVTQSPLMRPPYGSINSRVRRVIHRMGMIPVLWTIDSLDWTGISTAAIVHNVLSELHPGRNIVLQHDGVANSPRSVAALPRIVESARKRGYCFGRLDNRGHVRRVVPRVSISDATTREANRGKRVVLKFKISLNKPVDRRVTVQLRTRSRSAVGGLDYTRRWARLHLAPGTHSRTFEVRVHGDRLDERTEHMRVIMSAGPHTRVVDRVGVGTIRDNDRAVRAWLQRATVKERRPGHPRRIKITLHLRHHSGRMVGLHVITRPRSARPERDFKPLNRWVWVRRHHSTRTFPIIISGGRHREGVERFRLVIVGHRHAHVRDRVTVVRIRPPR
jgi:peptidoglycan/xylan/chitin deacetylase (PgdA/CDA1 family)